MEEFLKNIAFIDFMNYKAAAIIALVLFVALLMDDKS